MYRLTDEQEQQQQQRRPEVGVDWSAVFSGVLKAASLGASLMAIAVGAQQLRKKRR